MLLLHQIYANKISIILSVKPRNTKLGGVRFSVANPCVHLACLKSDQSLVAFIGDGDNLLSKRWGKFDSYSRMIHAAGSGGFEHVTDTG
jgi:hypothetical protein